MLVVLNVYHDRYPSSMSFCEHWWCLWYLMLIMSDNCLLCHFVSTDGAGGT